MASTDARPIPKKNTAYRHYFAIRDNAGALITSWAGADSELSKDGGAFADATNEATEIGSSGCGYIDLTTTEMNADAIMLKVTVTNDDALDYVVTFFPEEAGDIRTNVTQINGAGQTATLDTIKAETALIVEDTNEMQGNQGDWVTAVGFAVAGDAMTLTEAYNAAKSAAAAGAEMDLVDAPNATAITAIQSGLALQALLSDINDIVKATGTGDLAAIKTAAERLTANRASYIDKLNIGEDVIANTGNADTFKATIPSIPTPANIVSEMDSTSTKLAEITSARMAKLDNTLANTDNADSFKADVSGLSTFDPASDEVIANITKVNDVAVTDIDDFKATEVTATVDEEAVAAAVVEEIGLDDLTNILEADKKVVQTAGGWEKVYYLKGTSTVLLRKALLQADGTPVTDFNTTVGQEIDNE